MPAITTPFALFVSASGQPLDGARIYIGQPGQNPETTPAPVYWDEAKTIPAAQPLRTVSGFIVRNGAPANVYFSGGYAIAVKDKNNVPVFSDLNRSTNPDGYLAGLSKAQVNAALGYQPVDPEAAVLYGKVVITSETADFSAADINTLQVQAATGPGNAALMQYVIPGSYGIKLGLRADNTVVLGGYSMGSNVARLSSDAAGNLVALGNVTAYSDARFKEEVERIPDSVARTLQMEGITYLDNQTGQRKIGAIAQAAMQAGFGEAVDTDANGYLSLAYGQLALALVIENTRALHDEIVSLRAQINELKG